ncbi:hypothetical protein, partial [Bacillus thuringiensis]|uniref:hypothetical protein n=1 Tax=Bacillus thuringiensis TaxID=1428 RepID=UPI002852B929
LMVLMHSIDFLSCWTFDFATLVSNQCWHWHQFRLSYSRMDNLSCILLFVLALEAMPLWQNFCSLRHGGETWIGEDYTQL